MDKTDGNDSSLSPPCGGVVDADISIPLQADSGPMRYFNVLFFLTL